MTSASCIWVRPTVSRGKPTVGAFDLLTSPTRAFAPGAESWLEFVERVRATLERLARRFAGRVHVLHRSGNNRSTRHRRSYVLHYADARSKWLNDPKAKNPHLHATHFHEELDPFLQQLFEARRRERRGTQPVQSCGAPVSTRGVRLRALMGGRGRLAIADQFRAGLARCSVRRHLNGGLDLLFHWKCQPQRIDPPRAVRANVFACSPLRGDIPGCPAIRARVSGDAGSVTERAPSAQPVERAPSPTRRF